MKRKLAMVYCCCRGADVSRMHNEKCRRADMQCMNIERKRERDDFKPSGGGPGGGGGGGGLRLCLLHQMRRVRRMPREMNGGRVSSRLSLVKSSERLTERAKQDHQCKWLLSSLSLSPQA